ncbi:hypothetical protein ACOSP7_012417 [Xanthoceras sorbifolium]
MAAQKMVSHFWTIFLVASAMVSLSSSAPPSMPISMASSPSSVILPPYSMVPSPSSVIPPPYSVAPSPSSVIPPPQPMPYPMPPSPSSVIPPPPPPMPYPIPPSPSPMPYPMPPSPSPMPYPMLPSPSSVIPPPPPPMPYPMPPPPSSVISTPPPSMPPTNKGIKGGYWPSWLAKENPPSTIPTQYFTHLFYSYVTLDASTYQLSYTKSDVQWMPIFTATLHAKTPPAKAILSIGGGLSSPITFSNMANNTQTRSAFIKSAIQVARKYSFDGLDLDWEFPNTAQDMSNLALLFKEWRQAIELESKSYGNPQLVLSAAVYFAPDFFLADVPILYPGVAIRSYVDFVNQRCFDYHGSWETSFTGEHALVYDNSSRLSTSYGVDSWAFHGVYVEKLVMGLPLYGRTWKLKDPKQNGIGAPAVGVGPGNNGIIMYKDIEDHNLANGATVVYDDSIAVYSYAGTDWIGYDGPTSIWKKIEFAKHQGLGGYFFWAIGYDKNWKLSSIASSAWDARN